jgi:hypothetical protein
MGELIMRLWAFGTTVFCLVQLVLVVRSFMSGNSTEGRSISWGLITGFAAILLGSMAFGITEPLNSLLSAFF